MFLKQVSYYAHKGCIYLIKNTVKKMSMLKKVMLLNILAENVVLFLKIIWLNEKKVQKTNSYLKYKSFVTLLKKKS